MKRISMLVLAGALLIPIAASAANIGECGWGSKLMDGQSGVAPQVMAATTNGTSGNQTFAITSGTSGCTQDGVVSSKWKTAAYIDGNMNRLAKDISRGEGESLTTLSGLMGVDEKHQVAFNATLQGNFSELFPREDVSSEELTGALRSVLGGHPELSQYTVVL